MTTRGDLYSVDGLLTLYELEPSLRDVLVEGPTDRGFIEWFISEVGASAEVYDIDSRVDVPAALQHELGLDVNRRGRALALGHAANDRLDPGQTTVTVIVDADYSTLERPSRDELGCILLTDGPTLESYVLSPRPFEKFLRAGLHRPAEVTYSSVISQIFPALTYVYATRAVLHPFGIGLVASFLKTCTLKPNKSSADVRELIRRSAGSRLSETGKSLDELAADVDQLASRMIEIDQLMARGHDISAALRDVLGLTAFSVDAIEAIMLTSIDMVDVASADLFSLLRDRLRPSEPT